MEFAIKRNNAALIVKLIADQCYDIIKTFPEGYEKKNLRKSVNSASRLSQKLDNILRRRDYMNDWKLTTEMQLRPKQMPYREMCRIITRTRKDIKNFQKGLEKDTTNFAMLFEGIKVTDNCMRPFDMRDDLFIVKFYEHICGVQEAVNKIENNLETLKNSVQEKPLQKYNTDRCESPLPQDNKRIKLSYSYNEIRSEYTR